eukprot:403338747
MDTTTKTEPISEQQTQEPSTKTQVLTPLQEEYRLRIIKTQFQEWYPYFKKHSFKAEIIELSPRFIDYLNQDGVFLPEQEPEQDSDSDDSQEEDSKQSKDSQSINKIQDPEVRQAFLQEVSEIRKRIGRIIEKWENGVFVKLNWSAPRDAEWLNPTFQSISADEIFTLLKSSQFVAHDYSCPYHEAIPGFTLPNPHYLIIKRWHNLNLSMEFRVFVKNHTLVGISQRDCTAFYQFLYDEVNNRQIARNISEFFNNSIKQSMMDYCSEMSDYVIDVYVDVPPKSRVWLIDINPWIPESVDSLLFQWDELNQKDLSKIQFDGRIRVVENNGQIMPSDVNQFKVPADFEDMDRMQEFMKNMNDKVFNQ